MGNFNGNRNKSLCQIRKYCRMAEESGCGELQQLVQEEECEEPLSHGGEATPPSTPARSHHPSKNDTHSSHVSVWT